MKNQTKIITGLLGFIVLIPGIAKFIQPFKTFIYEHLSIIGFPFPGLMQYVVKISQISVGLMLIYLAFKGNSLRPYLKKQLFYFSNITVIVMMLVAIYTHLHPVVPARILPMEFKPPVIPILYIILTLINIYLFRKNLLNGN